MTTRENFLRAMSERRKWPRGSMDWSALTTAARKYLWILRDVPTTEWPE